MSSKNIEFKVVIDGVEQEIKSLKDLKKAIKEATDEQVRASEKYGIGSKEYTEASKRVSALKDKVDDLRDSTKSLQGSGIERASAGFNQLGEGLRNLDFDKVKVGLTAMKSALAATGIGLIVALVSTLAEKFDIFGKITEVVTDIIYGFTDALGLTNKAAEEQTKSMIENMDKQQKAVEDRYNSEIKLAKAAGKDTSDLEVNKLKELEKSVQAQITQLQLLADTKKGLNDEEQKKYEELQSKLLQLSSDRQAKEIENEKLKQQQISTLNKAELDAFNKLRVARLSEREKEIDAIKQRTKTELEELDKVYVFRNGSGKMIEENERKFAAAKKAIEEANQIEINKINEKYYKEDDEKRYKIQVEKWKAEQDLYEQGSRKINEMLIADSEAYNATLNADIEATNLNLLTKREMSLAARQKDFEDFKQDKERQYNLEKNTINAIQQVSDVFFMFKKQRAEKGSAEEERIAKRQFQINKALNLGLAVIDGFKSITTSLANAPIVIGAVPNPAGIASLAFAAITTAANIAKIASTQFQSSGGGGSSATAVGGAPSVPAPPTPSTQGGGTSTLFDQTGQATGNDAFRVMQGGNNEPAPIKAYVVETEISQKQKDIKTITEQATF